MEMPICINLYVKHLFDVDRNQWSESYIHQHISSPYKRNNCNGYGKSIPLKKFWRKNITRIFFPSGTNILRNKYTLTESRVWSAFRTAMISRLSASQPQKQPLIPPTGENLGETCYITPRENEFIILQKTTRIVYVCVVLRRFLTSL